MKLRGFCFSDPGHFLMENQRGTHDRGIGIIEGLLQLLAEGGHRGGKDLVKSEEAHEGLLADHFPSKKKKEKRKEVW